MKRKVFIGSSTKGLPVAEAIQKELCHDAEVILWSQGIFRMTNVAIEDLMGALNEFDFAIFVFLPEDMLNIREKEALSVRDNVLFELGLFLGKLGRERNFFVTPKNEPSIDLHLPSDLSGINPATYEPNARDIRSSIAPALYEIKQSIRSLGSSTKPLAVLYDSRKDFKEYHYVHRNACFWKGEKAVSPKSDASLAFLKEGVLKVERKNLEGRYEIELRRDGKRKPSISKKNEPIDRVLRASCEAKVDSGDHTLHFILKDEKAGKWADDQIRKVASTDWIALDMYFRVSSTVDLLFRIDCEPPSKVPATVFIRDLVIADVT